MISKTGEISPRFRILKLQELSLLDTISVFETLKYLQSIMPVMMLLIFLSYRIYPIVCVLQLNVTSNNALEKYRTNNEHF